MNEAERLRHDKDDRRERPDPAEQRTQVDQARSHLSEITNSDAVRTSTTCERELIRLIRQSAANPSNFLWATGLRKMRALIFLQRVSADIP